MATKQKKADFRGSHQAWVDAAYSTLVSTGIDAVTINYLAKKLKISRTSFYWVFKDRDSILAALLERWRARNTESIVRQAAQYATSVAEATLNVFDCWFDPGLFDAGLEFAVRSWAHQSAKVANEVTLSDAQRLDALKAMYQRFGHDALESDIRARATYLIQLGYITTRAKEDFAFRMQRIPLYCEICSGAKPSESEMKRFYARRNFSWRNSQSKLVMDSH